MAASSTEAYDGTKSQINKELLLTNDYAVCSVTTDQTTSFWTADGSSNSTSPSSDHNWYNDEEESIKRRIYEMKRQFHNGRFLILRNLPKDISEQDIRGILRDHYVHSVQIQPSTNTAKVVLAEPEVLDNWTQTKHIFNGKEVLIQPGTTEDILCVARLPQNCSEEEFAELAGLYGRVSFSFLMRSEKTGETKGYGFVSYASKEVALQAMASLHGKEVQQKTLVCDWVGSSLTTVASLHSTCLYVDGLPKDYRDMGEFRKIFSKYGTPIYCQIAMNHGVLQDWGLVEFNSPEEVENTRNHLNNHKIKDCPIRVDYWIPGVRAVTIYLNLLEEKSAMKKQALLPEPPTDKVFTQLNSLAKHNPAFAKSLQNIIQTQIENLQKGNTQPIPGTPVRPDAPRMTLMDMQRSLLTGQVNSMPLNSVRHEPLNHDAQAALVLLLAAQLQSQKGSINLLSDPRIIGLLQTLVSQGDPTQQSQPNASTSSLSSNLKANFRSGYFKNGPTRSTKAPLLPTPEASSANARSSPEDTNLNLGDLDSNIGSLLDGILNPQKETSPETDPSLSPLLTNAQGLQQILRSLNGDSLMGTPNSSSAVTSVNNITSLASQHPPLLQPPIYEGPDPIMLVRPEEQPRPDQFFAPMGHQAPFLYRAPSPIPPWQPTGFTSIFPPVFTPPHRLYSPLYMPVVSTHATTMAPPTGYTTPSRKKRKSSQFLPSPESSPETGYIGQHSQGLGGHYPDSYLQKKKTKLSS